MTNVNSVRLALISARLGYRALFAWNTPALFATSLLLTPALQMLFFVVLGKANGYGDPQFFICGNAILATAAAGVGGMVSVIADERRFATLPVVLTSPSSNVAVFVGRLLPGVLSGALASLVVSILGFTMAGLPFQPSSIGLYAIAILVASVSCSALGLALSAFGLVYRDIYQLATAAYLVMLVTSGANVAWSNLPSPLVIVGMALPAGHSIAAVRTLSDSGVGFWPQCGLELCVAAAWLAVALTLMRVFERRARQNASVDLS
ncbi:ABC transporter permease [Leifsonia xyli]|uniref:ABC transporter permease n=1 Tax=Leifsonia xyli TaxID=1575 RepID=UPI003D66E004